MEEQVPGECLTHALEWLVDVEVLAYAATSRGARRVGRDDDDVWRRMCNQAGVLGMFKPAAATTSSSRGGGGPVVVASAVEALEPYVGSFATLWLQCKPLLAAAGRKQQSKDLGPPRQTVHADVAIVECYDAAARLVGRRVEPFDVDAACLDFPRRVRFGCDASASAGPLEVRVAVQVDGVATVVADTRGLVRSSTDDDDDDRGGGGRTRQRGEQRFRRTSKLPDVGDYWLELGVAVDPESRAVELSCATSANLHRRACSLDHAATALGAGPTGFRRFVRAWRPALAYFATPKLSSSATLLASASSDLTSFKLRTALSNESGLCVAG